MRAPVEALIQVLGDESAVREAAAKALGRLGEPHWAEIVTGHDDDDFRRLGESTDPRAGKPLVMWWIRRLGSPWFSNRAQCAEALGRIG